MYKILIIANNSYADLMSLKIKDVTFKQCEVILHDDFDSDIDLSVFHAVVMQVKYPIFDEFLEKIVDLRSKYNGVLVVLDCYTVFKHKMFCSTHKVDLYYDLSLGFGDLIQKLRYCLVTKYMIENGTIEYKDIVLNLENRECRRGNCIVELRNKEFELLRFFVENPCRIFNVRQILESVWDMNADLNTNTVQTHLSYLRKKIDVGFSEKRLHTVNCVGYKFE
jgi:DNA-binding response OmpR family regulator